MKMKYNVLQRVRQIEEKKGIIYAKADGRLYKTVKFFYVLFWIYALAMNLLYVFANLLVHSGTEVFASIKNSLITVSIASAVMIIALIIMKFKDQIWSNVTVIALNLLSAVFLILTYANLMEDVVGLWGFKYSFYWRHSVPLAIIAILAVWLCAIALRANLKTNKQYKAVVNNLYEQYNLSAENEQLSEEEWEDFLKNYKF